MIATPRTREDLVKQQPSGLPRFLRHEREEAARIVQHDLPQHLVARAGGFQLRHEHRQRLARSPGRRCFFIWPALEMSAENIRLSAKPASMQRHHQRHLLRVAGAALAIEADERAAAADRLVHLRRCGSTRLPRWPMTMRFGFDAGVLEDVELLERRLSRECRCA